MVVSEANNFSNYSAPLLDLIQEGNIGLMLAAERTITAWATGSALTPPGESNTTPCSASQGKPLHTIAAKGPGVDDEVTSRALPETIRTALSGLSNQEQVVAAIRYGLGDNTPLTVSAIAKELGSANHRFRGTEQQAIAKLSPYPLRTLCWSTTPSKSEPALSAVTFRPVPPPAGFLIPPPAPEVPLHAKSNHTYDATSGCRPRPEPPRMLGTR